MRDPVGDEVRTVVKAADVLLCFSAERPRWRLSDLSRQLGLSKTVVHRLLGTLRRKGFVVREADHTYSLGGAVLQLARGFLDQGDLVATSHEPMRGLWVALEETVNLSIRVQHHRYCVHQLESPHALRYTLSVGQPLPLYAGTTGKLLLSTMTDEEVAAYLDSTPLVRRGPHTITDAARLWKEIQLIRERGYATSSEEMGPGGAGASAPVRGPGEVPIAALSVFGPTTRIPPRRIAEIAPMVVQAATVISQRMGSRPLPSGPAPRTSRARPRRPPRGPAGGR